MLKCFSFFLWQGFSLTPTGLDLTVWTKLRMVLLSPLPWCWSHRLEQPHLSPIIMAAKQINLREQLSF